MIRTAIIPEQQDISIHLPINYVGKKVEVLLFTIDEPENITEKNTMAEFWGVLSANTAKELRQQVEQSRNEWERDI